MSVDTLKQPRGLEARVRRSRWRATAATTHEHEQGRVEPVQDVTPPPGWQGPAPVPLAAPGKRMPWSAHQYAQLLAGYFLVAGVPRALWELLDCHRPWWPPQDQQPEPVLLAPRIRLMCAAYPCVLPTAFEDEIEQQLLALADAAQPFRPDWAERLRYHHREFQAARQRKAAAA
ncbi:MAG: hypothetical protein U0136_16130 [Bdellovibrionota bacterium]